MQKAPPGVECRVVDLADENQVQQLADDLPSLGHFALTAQLIDLVTRSENGRVVIVSSIAHKYGWIDFDNLNAEKGYKKAAAYGQSKLANLLFAYELQRRLQIARHKTRVVVAHPGYSATNLQRTMAFARLSNFLMAQSQSDGALPTLRAATDPDARRRVSGARVASWNFAVPLSRSSPTCVRMMNISPHAYGRDQRNSRECRSV